MNGRKEAQAGDHAEGAAATRGHLSQSAPLAGGGSAGVEGAQENGCRPALGGAPAREMNSAAAGDQSGLRHATALDTSSTGRPQEAGPRFELQAAQTGTTSSGCE